MKIKMLGKSYFKLISAYYFRLIKKGERRKGSPYSCIQTIFPVCTTLAPELI